MSVYGEDVGTLLIEEGVEVDDKEIIGETGPVTVGAIGPHDPRVGIVGMETKVDIGAVVRDVDFGILGGRCAVDRLALNEVGNPGRATPDSIVEPPVHDRWRVGPHRRHGRTARQDAGVDRSAKSDLAVTDGTAPCHLLLRRRWFIACGRGATLLPAGDRWLQSGETHR